MSSAAPSSSFLYFIIIIALVVIVRMRRIINGTRVSTARTVGYTAVYFLFAVFAISGSYFEGVSPEYFVLDVLLLLAGALWAFRHAEQRLLFWKIENSIFVKGATIIYLIYVIGLISRLAIEYVFVPSFFSFGTTIPSLSMNGLIATIVTDLLLSFGVGLLVGRNLQILKKYRKIRSGAQSVAESPVS